MFKLKQIQYNRYNAPEIEKRKVKLGLAAEKETVFRLYNGNLTNESEDSAKSGALYMVLDAVGASDKERYVSCYRITSDMLISVRFFASGVTPTEGMRFKLSGTSTGGYNALTYSAGEGEVIAVGTENYAKTKNILVRFDV